MFAALDALCGYWQVPFEDEENDKTKFTSLLGTVCHTPMPSGLRNSSAFFSRALDITLFGIL